MAGDDVYEDLPNFDFGNDAEKLKQQNDRLQEHITSLEEDVEKCCATILKMKETQNNLTRNISELFKTAKAEIQRKDLRLADLQRQLDDILLKRQDYGGYKRFNDSSNPHRGPAVAVENVSNSEADSKPIVTNTVLKHDNETKLNRDGSPKYNSSELNPKRYKRDHYDNRGSRQNYKRSRSKSRDRYRNTYRGRSNDRNDRRKYNRERSGERRRRLAADAKRNLPMDFPLRERSEHMHPRRNEETRKRGRSNDGSNRCVDNSETRNNYLEKINQQESLPSKKSNFCNVELSNVEKQRNYSEGECSSDDLEEDFQLEKDTVVMDNLISQTESNPRQEMVMTKEKDTPVQNNSGMKIGCLKRKEHSYKKLSSKSKIDEFKFNEAEKLRLQALNADKDAFKTNGDSVCKIVKRRVTNTECKFVETKSREEISNKINEDSVEIKKLDTAKSDTKNEEEKEVKKIVSENKSEKVEKPGGCLSDKSKAVEPVIDQIIAKSKVKLSDESNPSGSPIGRKSDKKEKVGGRLPDEIKPVERALLGTPKPKLSFLQAEVVKDMDDISTSVKPMQVAKRKFPASESEDLIKKLVIQEENRCNAFDAKKKKKKVENEKNLPTQNKNSALLKQLFDDDSSSGKNVSDLKKLEQQHNNEQKETVTHNNNVNKTKQGKNVENGNIVSVSIFINPVKLDENETDKTNFNERENAINSSSEKSDDQSGFSAASKKKSKKNSKEKKIEPIVQENSVSNRKSGRILRSALKKSNKASPTTVQCNSNLDEKSIKQTNELEVKWPDDDTVPVLHISETSNFPKTLLDMANIDLDDDLVIPPINERNLENLVTSTPFDDHANSDHHPTISDIEILKEDLNLSCESNSANNKPESNVTEKTISPVETKSLSSSQTNSTALVNTNNSSGRRRRRWCTITMVD